MKVIITGGTGLIGGALAHRLSEDGDEVVVLSRGEHKPPDLPDSVRVVQWDAASGEGWGTELKDTDAVINLAGANLSGGRWTQKRKQVIRDSRINAGKAIIDAVNTTGYTPRRLIQASGISYYGNRSDKCVDESDPPGDDFLSTLSIEWEGTTEPLEKQGVNRAVIRSGAVLNTGAGALPPIAMPFLLFAGGRIGSGRQGFSWIHVDDEVNAIRFLLQHETLNGPFNLCAPEPVSNRQLADTVGLVMNRPARFPAPELAIRTVLGEVADTVLLGQYAIPSRLTDAGFEFRFPTLESALDDLLGSKSSTSRVDLFRTGVASFIRLLLP